MASPSFSPTVAEPVALCTDTDVTGAPFYANAPESNTLRLSFVTVPPERIREGVAKLGKLLAKLV